jgi:hypothetical protein
MNTASWQGSVIETPMQQRKKAIRENKAALVANDFMGLLRSNRGEYALMRSGQVIEVYAEPYDAIDAGLTQFPNDFLYSIEKIESEPVFMGMCIGLVASTEK